MNFKAWFLPSATPPPVSPSPDALAARVEYADGLLALMVKQSRFHLTLRADKPLPDLCKADGSPLRTPDYLAVANRLKILARLNPVRYLEPVQGVIEVSRSGHVLVYTLRFEDKADPPAFDVTLTIRGR